MKKVFILSTIALLIAAPATAAAAEQATVSITSKTVGPNFEYDLTLHNTGTTALGTLWFAWIPGQDYLSISPSSETSPTGWNQPAITHGGPTDGFAVQWIATTPLAAGASLSGFSFTTSEAPSIVEGTSAVPLYAGIATDTYFTYVGEPLVGTPFESTAVAAPEPATLSLLSLAAIAVLSRRKSRL